MTVEILLPMTAGQSHNWLVDMSLSITDVSIGAEHWSGGKESTFYIYNSTETLKTSTASSFYLAKLNSLWYLAQVEDACRGLLLQGLFHTGSTGAVIGPWCFLDCENQLHLTQRNTHS